LRTLEIKTGIIG